MDRFAKFQMLVAIIFNLNGGQFYKDISKFGYFNKLLILFKIGFKDYFVAGPHKCREKNVEMN